MSFDSKERSSTGSMPVSLYEFRSGNTYWRYSSDEEDTVLNGVVYESCAISDGGISQSGDPSNDDFVVTLPYRTPVAQLYVGTPPTESIWLTKREVQRGENDAPVVWLGTLKSAKQVDVLMSEISCQMITNSFDRNGLRLAWSRMCPHALYDKNCGVNRNQFVVVVLIEALSGSVVRYSGLASLPTGYLSNGYFEWTRGDGSVDRRAIEVHSGAQFSVLGTTDGLSVGMTIRAYPGCPRTTNACVEKFNNLVNYGGVPHMPGKNPFAGDPVF